MNAKPIDKNTLYYGDNLKILREYIPDESIDLIYLDPPFNSNRTYNVLFADESGQESEAQIKAFDDTWHWDSYAVDTYSEIVKNAPPNVGTMIQALREFIGENQMMAYLVMMTIRLVELHRVLKPTGSIYLHCDPTASHYLKIILDTILGPENYKNDIIWVRSTNPKGSQHKSLKFGVYTDNLLYFSKSKNACLNLEDLRTPLTQEELEEKYHRIDEIGIYYDAPILRSTSMGTRPNLVYEYKGYTPGAEGWRVELEKLIEIDKQGNLGWSKTGKPFRKLRPENDRGKPIANLWDDISLINSQAAERLGYPTQKPLELLERVIIASSIEGDVVLDPFCGCGTAVVAAQKLNRKWIGIDITHLSIALQKYRMQDMFNIKAGKDYDVVGEPEDLESAKDLAVHDRFQFQFWAISLIHAKPLGGQEGSKKGKKGADRGIDGVTNFEEYENGKLTFKNVLIQVKSGHVKSGDIRDFRGTIERENAPIGVFITLEEPTKPMLKEALSAGKYKSEAWGKEYPRIQILTIEQLFNGSKIDMPEDLPQFKKAQKAVTKNRGKDFFDT